MRALKVTEVEIEINHSINVHTHTHTQVLGKVWKITFPKHKTVANSASSYPVCLVSRFLRFDNNNILSEVYYGVNKMMLGNKSQIFRIFSKGYHTEHTCLRPDGPGYRVR